ncbi:MAG: hypothetical protein KC431_22400 [Myxococcales bacterium]|nr:hypothetical protein [Myxococcales bacterium]
MQPSSADLHPKSGARFVFTRRDSVDGSADDALRYDLEIYLPAGRDWRGELRWQDGRSVIVDEPGEPDEGLGRALAEAHKLARVLHRDPKPKLSRWRGLD